MTIAERVIEIVGHDNLDGDRDISLETRLDYLKQDELDMALLVIEDEFGLEIDDLLAERWTTVGDIVKYVEEAKGKEG